MNTCLVYFDETGDDGANTLSSNQFVLTSIYMQTDTLQENFNKIRNCRKELKDRFGFHISEEIHTKHLVRDKGFYRSYGWTDQQRRDILIAFTKCIASLDLKIINVIIDKTKIRTEDYCVLEKALTYNIQRIDNDSHGQWNYLAITDKGRLAPMRKTARAIRAYNPVQSHFGGYTNQPIKGMVEDIMEKDSAESYFVQICDFVSYFVDLYYRSVDKKRSPADPCQQGNRYRFHSQRNGHPKTGQHLKSESQQQPPSLWLCRVSQIKTPPTRHSPFQWFNYIISFFR